MGICTSPTANAGFYMKTRRLRGVFKQAGCHSGYFNKLVFMNNSYLRII